MADLDIRDMDTGLQHPAEGVNKALAVYGLARNAQMISSPDTTEFYGFYVNNAGTTDWTIKFKESGATVTFDPQANTLYPFHVVSITVGTGGTGFGFIG